MRKLTYKAVGAKFLPDRYKSNEVYVTSSKVGFRYNNKKYELSYDNLMRSAKSSEFYVYINGNTATIYII